MITVLFTIGIHLPPRSEAQQPANKAVQQRTDKSAPPTITYVDNRRDEAERQPTQNKPPNGYVSSEWALVIVGIITFVVIGWQAWETRKSAEAANRSIALQTESLRPRLSISNFTNDVFSEAHAGEWVTVKMKIGNSGGLPAYGMIAETWIEFIEGVPPYTFSPNARYREAAPLNIHTGKPHGFFIPLHRKLSTTEIQQMAKAQGCICFRIKMRYRAFGEDVYTDEAFMARPSEMESIPEYTSAT